MSIIGENILKARKNLGITQEELAKRLGYKSKSTINKIELGINDIPQRKLIQFAKALQTTVEDLIGTVEDDDLEFVRSLGPLKPLDDLTPDVEALNLFMYGFGERIIKTDGRLFLGECGELSEDDLAYLCDSAESALKIAFEVLKKKRLKEMMKQ